MIEITENMKRAAHSLAWLSSRRPGTMKSGRTTVLAINAIKCAIDSPGIPVFMADHYPGEDGGDHVRHTVRWLLEDSLDKFKLDRRMNTIVFKRQ